VSSETRNLLYSNAILLAVVRAADKVTASIESGDPATLQRINANGIAPAKVTMVAQLSKAKALMQVEPEFVPEPKPAPKYAASGRDGASAIIIAHLMNEGPCSATCLEKTLNLARISVNRAVSSMVDQGVLHFKRLVSGPADMSKEAIYAMATDDLAEHYIPGFDAILGTSKTVKQMRKQNPKMSASKIGAKVGLSGWTIQRMEQRDCAVMVLHGTHEGSNTYAICV
jgi:hypothetical protein